jgi:hypothetical protein
MNMYILICVSFFILVHTAYLPDDVILETVRMLNFDELVTYNRTHMTAYAVLRPIFNLARECGIKTWPELDFELGPKILTEGCMAKIRKYSVLYTGVTLRALGMSKDVERVLGGISNRIPLNLHLYSVSGTSEELITVMSAVSSNNITAITFDRIDFTSNNLNMIVSKLKPTSLNAITFLFPRLDDSGPPIIEQIMSFPRDLPTLKRFSLVSPEYIASSNSLLLPDNDYSTVFGNSRLESFEIKNCVIRMEVLYNLVTHLPKTLKHFLMWTNERRYLFHQSGILTHLLNKRSNLVSLELETFTSGISI